MAEVIRHKRPERVRLGDLLLQQKLISQEQLKAALEDQGRSGRKLGKVLIESGYLSEDQIGEALARQLSVPFINLKYYNFNSAVTRKLPEAQARRFRALLLEEQDDMVLVAMVDPTDLFAFDEISRLTRKEVNIAVVSETMLLQTIDRIYRRTDQISSLARELGEDLGDIVDLGTLTLGAEDAPVVKLLQTMFEDAIQARASDIHIEPHEKGLHIRFRIDGLLQPQTETDAKISSAVAQRLKLMSGLDISERRLPQDGRFNVKVRNHPIDVRISSMPTQYGETIVMRLLHRAGGVHQLADLGMSPEMLERFGKAIHRYTGMVLVTGPTGSGKTTTLYAALNELNKPDCKIITVEDPVEYRLDGLNQVQVNEKIELRGDARCRDGANRSARGHYGPHGAVDAAHSRRGELAAAVDRHGRAALHGRLLAPGRRGAAPPSRQLRILQQTAPARPAGSPVAAHRGLRPGRGADHGRERLPALQRQRLRGENRDLRNARNGQRARGARQFGRPRPLHLGGRAEDGGPAIGG